MNWSSSWNKSVKLSLIINEGDFPTQVEAIQVGDLAVHKDLYPLPQGNKWWQVTHVPTLTRFNVVSNGLHKQANLIEWCKKVQEQLKDDWKALAQLTPETYIERSIFKDRIMELCQRIPVG